MNNSISTIPNLLNLTKTIPNTPSPIHSEYDLLRLSDHELASISMRLKPLFKRTWNCQIDKTYLKQKIGDTVHCSLKLIESEKEVVGCMILFGYQVKEGEKSIYFFKGTALINSGFRGKNLLAKYFYKNSIKFLAKHPFAETYFIDTPCHPSSFLSIHKNKAHVYPTTEGFIPPRMVEMVQLAKEKEIFSSTFSFPFDDPYLCHCPFNTIETTAAQNSWQQKMKTDKYVQFFHKVGAMQKDRAYVVISPVSINNTLQTLLKMGMKSLKALVQKTFH